MIFPKQEWKNGEKKPYIIRGIEKEKKRKVAAREAKLIRLQIKIEAYTGLQNIGYNLVA